MYLDKIKGWGANSTNEQTEVDTTTIEHPQLIKPGFDVDDSQYLADTAVPSEQILSQPLVRPWVAQQPAPPSRFPNLPQLEVSSNAAAIGENGIDVQDDGSGSSGYSESTVSAGGQLLQSMTSVRVNGVVSDLAVVLEASAKVIGLAGMAMGPVFIILDFSHGQPIGGAFGAIGLFLGLVATSVIGGPVGLACWWIIRLLRYTSHLLWSPGFRSPSNQQCYRDHSVRYVR